MYHDCFRVLRFHSKNRHNCSTGIAKNILALSTWLNGKEKLFKTFISFYVSEANRFVSVFAHKCLMMLNDVEYTTFKMFVT